MKTHGIVPDTVVPPDSLCQPSRTDAPVTTTLKLSEAIRLGAMLGPQHRQGYREGEATCAYGAALAAVGVTEEDQFPFVIVQNGWAPVQPEFASPVDGVKGTLFGTVTTLNDVHGWTREQIADWLEGLER